MKSNTRGAQPEKRGRSASFCDTPMVNGLKTAIEKPTLVARIDMPRPMRESQPREKDKAMMMGTSGMTSSKMPKNAPRAMKKKVMMSSRAYFRPPKAWMMREMTDLRMPLLSITAKA